MTHEVKGLVPVTEQEARLALGEGHVAEPYEPEGSETGVGTFMIRSLTVAKVGARAPVATATSWYW